MLANKSTPVYQVVRNVAIKSGQGGFGLVDYGCLMTGAAAAGSRFLCEKKCMQ